MARHESKWAYMLEHLLPSTSGYPPLLFKKPGWALSLLRARARAFAGQKLEKPLRTPDGFNIESRHELVSYWSLFVERECRDASWIESIKAEKEPVFVDVGANAGLFTHLVWTLRKDCKLIAFEPLPRMGNKIESWRAATRANLTLHRKAVSSACGFATFFAAEDNDPTASLKPIGAKSLELNVPLVTLDSVLPEEPITLIKIDVEGCEPEVLAGAKKTLSRTRYLIVEAHSKKALEVIEAELGSEWQSRRVGASDYLFRREDA